MDVPVPVGFWRSVGHSYTGFVVESFIDELARIKGRIEGAVSSSKASTQRLKEHGIRVFDLNSVNELRLSMDIQKRFMLSGKTGEW